MSSNPSSPGPGSPGSNVSVQQLEQTAQAIAQKLEGLRSEQRSLRSVLILGSLLLITTMLVFGWKLWSAGRENFSEAKVNAALASTQERLAPELRIRANRLYQQLYPVYTRAAMERWDVIRPQIQARLAAEAEAFPEDLQRRINSDVSAAFKRVELNVKQNLEKELPTLAFERLGDVQELVKASLITQADKLHERLAKLYSNEVTRFKKVLDKFPVPDTAEMDRNALQKRFLHELIQLVDYEIFVYGTPEGLSFENVRMELNVGNPEDPVKGPDKAAPAK